MRIVISNTAGQPIYEQIASQIRAAILTGELAEGEKLPSIRGLARDLRVSVITTTRAYSDLAAEGFIANVQGKGSFVLPRDGELMREAIVSEVEKHLAAAIDAARLGRLTDDDVRASFEALLAASDDMTERHDTGERSRS
ncbi:MAG: GntR family transcriptional regulator [Dermatophilus congolensis]|nr:GntR family transcriptional regulator [Dermatophilus congolensis]